jgi:hypothetical protein
VIRRPGLPAVSPLPALPVPAAPKENPMDRTQLACYSLIASACVLAGILFVRLPDTLPRAQANMIAGAGQVHLMTAQTTNQEESLFVIDDRENNLLIYTCPQAGQVGRLELKQVIDLAGIFEAKKVGPGKKP